jgi:PST family polysaccharide transporter
MSNVPLLRRTAISGAAWTGISQVAVSILHLLSLLILARLLAPDVFGKMAMVMAVIGFANLFKDLGLSAAAIQDQTLSDVQQSNLFWLNATVGVVLAILVTFASPIVAAFYQEPDLQRMVLALSTLFVFGGVGAQYGAELIRKMRFKLFGLASVIGAFVTVVVSIQLARLDYGVWSLVFGTIAGAAAHTLSLVCMSRLRIMKPQGFQSIQTHAWFGANLTGFNVVNYLQRNLDTILVAKYWGAASVGFYDKAYMLLMMPLKVVREPITTAAYPVLSQLKSHPSDFRQLFLDITTAVAVLSMPLIAYLAAVAQPLITVALGEQWLETARIFQWLAVAAFVQPASGIAGTAILALGLSKRQLICGLFNSSVIIVGFVVGIGYGPIGVAISYAITNIVIIYPWLSFGLRETPISVADCLGASLIPAIVSLFAAAVTVMSRLLMVDFSAEHQLIVGTCTFVAAVGLPILVAPPLRKMVADSVKSIVGMRKAAEDIASAPESIGPEVEHDYCSR